MVQRTALVTGANRGIGREIARKLGEAGYLVILGCRDEKKGQSAMEKLSAEGLHVHAERLDVADAVSIQACAARIRDHRGRLDVLVNNAGIQIDGETTLLELDPVILGNSLETNALGPLQLAQACIPLMKENGYGRIVNLASTLGSLADMADPGSPYAGVDAPAYRMSKTLLNAVTVLLAREVRGHNILVNSACPGWVRTDMGGKQAPLSPAEGADTPVWLATLPDRGPNGGFFRERKPVPW
jgi:NAD(P)-dependent dehydrogenase (short-subunit alcohol dehydrogenase family)